MMSFIFQIAVLSGILLFPTYSFSQVVSARKASGGLFDFNYYRDNRDFTVFTMNLLATADTFQYFGFTNYESKIGGPDEKDSSSYYTEQNFRLKLSESCLFSLSFQAALQSGEQNDVIRGGVLIDASKVPALRDFFQRHNIRLGMNVFPAQLDDQSGYDWQLEYFYNIQVAPSFTGDRLYLSGFADQNLGDQETIWVTEHQVGFRFYDNFFLVSEYRINEYFRKQTGIAYGVEYALSF